MATAYRPYEPGTEPRGHLVPAALKAPFQARVWREFLYLVISLPMSVLTFVYTITMLALGAGLLITFLGVPVLGAALAGCRALGVVERARARALLRLDVAEPEPVLGGRGGRGGKRGPVAWVGALLRSGTSWRHVIYALIHLPWALFSFTFAIAFTCYGWGFATYPLWRWVFPRYVDEPGLQIFGDDHGRAFYLDTPFEIAATWAVGVLVLLLSPWVMRALTSVDRIMVAGLLGPSRLASRVWELESDRGTVVDTAAADLRRIERDLHDGAQARLVALAMDLGLAKEKLDEDPEAAAKMVDEAHGEVKLALQELRDLARGIHPAILTDRGLGPALSALSARCTVPVTVTVDLPQRPAPAIEGIAYFTVSELLQNISKHSGARTAEVDVWRTEDRVLLQITDDGRGGAGTSAGSGLAGLAERIDAVDGVLVVNSPPGGPTTVTAELPWR
ncbi:sensor histidine kinase [Streptomyces sp. PSAA01]|uniref:sensor histidine kinase n=1 Tax=Streptomyces sp. PSAA01 TaxID=2912762 RepID=UPI001F2D29D3|nr:sensor histidine kinase [Streptomyces sp. PSAA01]MCG0286298.1 sensor domain-containing protein [Streptomyces sp. PSAA01]